MAKRGKIKVAAATRTEVIRPIRWRRYKYFMLIICEDQKTEPAYFQRLVSLFPPETVYVRTIGTGRKPKGIVEQAIREREILHEQANKEADEVWLVFDKDDEGNNETTLQNFEEAWQRAVAENLNIAFSNEVFELWLLLHLADVAPDCPMRRHEIYLQLQDAVQQFAGYGGFTYKHGDIAILEVVEKVGSETRAIHGAKALQAFHKQANNKPLQANPSTTVYLLIEKLRDLLAWYSESN
jgi:hypothetical protein